MRLYMDQDQVDAFGIGYYNREDDGKEFVLSVTKIINSRREVGKTYDATHMDFFNSVGIQNNIKVRYAGLGWFEFISIA